MLAKLQQQISCLLGHPHPCRLPCHAQYVDASGRQLDDEQHVQPPEEHRVDGEEVRSQHALGLGVEELSPGDCRPRRCRSNPSTSKDAPDRAGAKPLAEPAQLAVDPTIAPGRILPGQSQHQLAQLHRHAWTTTPVWVDPTASDQVPAPAQSQSTSPASVSPVHRALPCHRSPCTKTSASREPSCVTRSSASMSRGCAGCWWRSAAKSSLAIGRSRLGNAGPGSTATACSAAAVRPSVRSRAVGRSDGIALLPASSSTRTAGASPASSAASSRGAGRSCLAASWSAATSVRSAEGSCPLPTRNTTLRCAPRRLSRTNQGEPPSRKPRTSVTSAPGAATRTAHPSNPRSSDGIVGDRTARRGRAPIARAGEDLRDIGPRQPTEAR